jgi:hypothetical protein
MTYDTEGLSVQVLTDFGYHNSKIERHQRKAPPLLTGQTSYVNMRHRFIDPL